MTPIRKSTRLQILCAILVAVLIASATALATPSVGITQVVVENAVYHDIDIDAKRPDWKAWLKVTGVSDVFVNSNIAIPGANGGWHSHPGLSIVSVTHGAVTLYDADSCTQTIGPIAVGRDLRARPLIITAGHGFVEEGDHVHLLRNEGNIDARWLTTAIRPAGSAGRIDQPRPANCPF